MYKPVSYNYCFFKYYFKYKITIYNRRIQSVSNNAMMTDYTEVDSSTVENHVIETSNESIES